MSTARWNVPVYLIGTGILFGFHRQSLIVPVTQSMPQLSGCDKIAPTHLVDKLRTGYGEREKKQRDGDATKIMGIDRKCKAELRQFYAHNNKLIHFFV